MVSILYHMLSSTPKLIPSKTGQKRPLYATCLSETIKTQVKETGETVAEVHIIHWQKLEETMNINIYCSDSAVITASVKHN